LILSFDALTQAVLSIVACPFFTLKAFAPSWVNVSKFVNYW